MILRTDIEAVAQATISTFILIRSHIQKIQRIAHDEKYYIAEKIENKKVQ